MKETKSAMNGENYRHGTVPGCCVEDLALVKKERAGSRLKSFRTPYMDNLAGRRVQ